MNWNRVLGRVSFVNCDPLFHGISDNWGVLPAPPSWLTGHVLKKDCLVAPIPTAAYAEHHSDLILLPDICIGSDGEVGSVLLFSNKDLSDIKDIALPTDSSTSTKLVMYVLEKHGITPNPIEMGPDLSHMLDICDAALLIGDRALDEANRFPELVKLDLGSEWKRITGLPMVFAVFAALNTEDKHMLNMAHNELLDNAIKFKQDMNYKQSVIDYTTSRSGFNRERVLKYFGEVTNILDNNHRKGLELFLKNVCNLSEPVNWLEK
ncbi:MAG: hypothetical protein CMO20_03870 [Thermoplasmata archaeon]|nr:hypothetical protein [Thermoplasmata archaeon]